MRWAAHQAEGVLLLHSITSDYGELAAILGTEYDRVRAQLNSYIAPAVQPGQNHAANATTAPAAAPGVPATLPAATHGSVPGPTNVVPTQPGRAAVPVQMNAIAGPSSLDAEAPPKPKKRTKTTEGQDGQKAPPKKRKKKGEESTAS